MTTPEQGPKIVYGGVRCREPGALGENVQGTPLICGVAKDGNLRWQRRFPKETKSTGRRRKATAATGPVFNPQPIKLEPAPAPVDLEQRIRDAYRSLTDRPGNWVSLTRLRPALAPAARSEVDAALERMLHHPDVNLVPESNQKTLTDADRRAAIRIGNQDKHLICIGVHAYDSDRDTDLDWVRSAVDASHTAQVVVHCARRCGNTFKGDFAGTTEQARLAKARVFLAGQDWTIGNEDVCPSCTHLAEVISRLESVRAELPDTAREDTTAMVAPLNHDQLNRIASHFGYSWWNHNAGKPEKQRKLVENLVGYKLDTKAIMDTDLRGGIPVATAQEAAAYFARQLDQMTAAAAAAQQAAAEQDAPGNSA